MTSIVLINKDDEIEYKRIVGHMLGTHRLYRSPGKYCRLDQNLLTEFTELRNFIPKRIILWLGIRHHFWEEVNGQWFQFGADYNDVGHFWTITSAKKLTQNPWLINFDISEVQPMSHSVGKIFSIRPKYSL